MKVRFGERKKIRFGAGHQYYTGQRESLSDACDTHSTTGPARLKWLPDQVFGSEPSHTDAAHLEAGTPHLPLLGFRHHQTHQLPICSAPAGDPLAAVYCLGPAATEYGGKAMMLQGDGAVGDFYSELGRGACTTWGPRCISSSSSSSGNAK